MGMVTVFERVTTVFVIGIYKTTRGKNEMEKRKKQSFLLKHVFHQVGKSIHQFSMIEDGDRILVGVSGVDSLCLLWVLRERLKWIPVSYELKAIFIDPGFNEEVCEHIGEYLQRENFGYEIIKTNIGLHIQRPGNKKSPCFLCSWERRKRLFLYAHDMGYNKIALGHHMDDINVTLFLNMLYGSSISTMLPRQEFFDGEIILIRPLAMLSKEKIGKLTRLLKLPSLENSCPFSENSQRSEVEAFLNHFYKKDRRIRYNIFHALRNVKGAYLPA